MGSIYDGEFPVIMGSMLVFAVIVVFYRKFSLFLSIKSCFGLDHNIGLMKFFLFNYLWNILDYFFYMWSVVAVYDKTHL